MVSRQYEWQKKQRALGNCTICGKPRDGKSQLACKKCLTRYRLAKRKKLGLKKWRPGHRGRPPYDATP